MRLQGTWWAGLALAAGCGGARAASDWGGTIDTLPGGTIVVTNPERGIWREGDSWRVVEEVRIGAEDGDGPEVLGRISALAEDVGGRFWALESGDQAFKVFGADGRFVRTFGRKGGGPGEMQQAAGIAFTSDGHLMVVDPQGARVSVFDTAGAFVRSNVAALADAATRIVRRIAPTAPIENVLTVAQIKDQSVAPRRLNAALVSSFGILAVIIAAVGIAGVLAFSVSARTTEIGIRMSLGADSGQVHRMILREGGVLLALGLGLGVGGALLGTRGIRGLLFGIAPHDPLTFVGVAVLMAAIGTAACWIPALRAARIDPAIAMRSE